MWRSSSRMENFSSSWSMDAWLATRMPSPRSPTTSLLTMWPPWLPLRVCSLDFDVTTLMNMNPSKEAISMEAGPSKLPYGLTDWISLWSTALRSRPTLKGMQQLPSLRSTLLKFDYNQSKVEEDPRGGEEESLSWLDPLHHLFTFDLLNLMYLIHFKNLPNLMKFLRMIKVLEHNRLQAWNLFWMRMRVKEGTIGFKLIPTFESWSATFMWTLDIAPMSPFNVSFDVKEQR